MVGKKTYVKQPPESDVVADTLYAILISGEANDTARIQAARALAALRLRDEGQRESNEEREARAAAVAEAKALIDDLEKRILAAAAAAAVTVLDTQR